MAQAPRPGASRRADASQSHFSFIVEGKTYTFRFDDISGRLVKECKDVTGYKPLALFQSLSTPADLDLDIIAAMIWVCQRQAGEEADFEALLDEVTYRWLESMEWTEEPAPEDPDSPPL